MERCRFDTQNLQIQPELELDLILSLVETIPDKSSPQVADLLLKAYRLDKSDLAFRYLQQAEKADPKNFEVKHELALNLWKQNLTEPAY